MAEVGERLTECFKIVFPNLTPDEIPRANSVSIATWDSLATVTLVSLIEEEFGVIITPDDYESLVSFDLIKHCLESKLIHA